MAASGTSLDTHVSGELPAAPLTCGQKYDNWIKGSAFYKWVMDAKDATGTFCDVAYDSLKHSNEGRNYVVMSGVQMSDRAEVGGLPNGLRSGSPEFRAKYGADTEEILTKANKTRFHNDLEAHLDARYPMNTEYTLEEKRDIFEEDTTIQSINRDDFLTGVNIHFETTDYVPEWLDGSWIGADAADALKEDFITANNRARLSFNAVQKGGRYVAQLILGAAARKRSPNLQRLAALAAGIVRVVAGALSAVGAFLSVAISCVVNISFYALKIIIPAIPLFELVINFFIPDFFDLPDIPDLFIPFRIFAANLIKTTLIIPAFILSALIYVVIDGVGGGLRQLGLGGLNGKGNEKDAFVQTFAPVLERLGDIRADRDIPRDQLGQIAKQIQKLRNYRDAVTQIRFGIAGYFNDQLWNDDRNIEIGPDKESVSVSVGAKSWGQNMMKGFLNFCELIENGNSELYEYRWRSEDATRDSLESTAREVITVAEFSIPSDVREGLTVGDDKLIDASDDQMAAFKAGFRKVNGRDPIDDELPGSFDKPEIETAYRLGMLTRVDDDAGTDAGVAYLLDSAAIGRDTSGEEDDRASQVSDATTASERPSVSTGRGGARSAAATEAVVAT